MKILYTNSIHKLNLIFTFMMGLVLITHASFASPALPRDTSQVQGKSVLKITDTRKEQPTFLKNGIKVNVVPFKPSAIKVAANTTANNKPNKTQEEKILSNVKVYPNPVSDQLNVNYFVSRDVTMTIKIMDFLGNEVATLLSQRIDSGEQTNTFNISSKLNSGLYFIRFIAGNETVIKRISVL
ncbi:MAG: T9SS type A sorting domain-containing protein [Sphingobacteriaceae bacterium]